MYKNKVYVIFSGDEWLSNTSLTFMGVYSSVDKAINAMITNSDCGDMIELQSMINEMRTDLRTFGHDVNWMIEEHYIDE